MTVKCKSIKATPDMLDDYVNRFLDEEKVKEIVHVVSSQASGSTSRYLTIFYKEPAKRKPTETKISEVNNG
jgi:hypothetical protein